MKQFLHIKYKSSKRTIPHSYFTEVLRRGKV